MTDSAPDQAPRPSTRKRIGTAAALIALFVLVVGAIVVLPRQVHVIPGIKGCTYLSAKDARTDCYQGVARDRIDEDGAGAALRALDADAADNERLYVECHTAMHEVGIEWGEKAGANGIDNGQVLPSHQGECVSGFVHGAVQGAIPNALGDPKLAGIARRICAPPDVDSYARGNCYHAVGHALYGTGVDDLDIPLADCRGLGDGKEQGDCAEGVFMSYVLDRSPNPADYRELCEDTVAELRRGCYGYLSLAASVTGESPASLLPGCADVTPGDARATCIYAIGRALGTDASLTCFKQLPTTALRRACVAGTVGSLRTLDEMVDTCADHATEYRRATCMEEIGRLMSARPGLQVDKDPERTCTSAVDDAKLEAACLAGIGDPLPDAAISDEI
jgi:hypothetical protein